MQESMVGKKGEKTGKVVVWVGAVLFVAGLCVVSTLGRFSLWERGLWVVRKRVLWRHTQEGMEVSGETKNEALSVSNSDARRGSRRPLEAFLEDSQETEL